MTYKKIILSCLLFVGLTASAQWQLLGPAGFSAGTANYQSIALDSQDSVYVAYQDAANSSATTVMKFDGANWNLVGTAGFSTAFSTYQSLAIDSDDTLYVAFQDPAVGSRVSVMKFDGTNWVFVGTQGFSAGASSYIDLEIDHTSDRPVVAFQDNANGGRTTVMEFNGTVWQAIGSVGFSAGGALYQSLDFDVNGAPFVAYSDANAGARTTVMRFNGSTWVNVGPAGFSPSLAIYQSIAISAEDSVYVAYRDAGNGDLTTVMKYDGTSGWFPVQSVGISSNVASYQSLITDHGNRPVVAYRDGNSGAGATVRRHFFGWSDVGSPTFTSGGADFTSLAGDECGNYFLAFSDLDNGNQTTVMWYDGSDPPALAGVFGDTAICQDEPFGSTQVTIVDDDSCDTYTLTVTSSDQSLIPDTAIDIIGGFPSYSFSFNPVTGQSGGPVTITVTADDGTNTTDTTFEVTIHPTYVQQVTDSICEGDSIFLEGSFQTTSGIYNDTFPTVFGCDSVVETILTVVPLPVTNETASICDGDSILLGGDFQSTPGMYDDTLTTGSGCDSIVRTTLTVNSVSNTSVSQTICEGESIFLEGEDQTEEGVYIDTLTNPNTGCDSIVETNLSVYPEPAVDAGNDKTTDQFTPVTLDGLTNTTEYSWTPPTGLDDPTSLTPNANPEVTTTYILTVIGGNGCEATDTVTVTIEELTEYIVNTMLTPNGDGKNDTWDVDHPELLDGCRVMVMNRWGTKVYTSTGYANNWDGTKAGQKLPEGTYYYIIKCDGADVRKGSISLIR